MLKIKSILEIDTPLEEELESGGVVDDFKEKIVKLKRFVDACEMTGYLDADTIRTINQLIGYYIINTSK